VIRTWALTKRYGSVTAVDGVELDVRRGDVYGFLGPNGSGKTTTVRMLLGLVLPTSGEIEVLDMRVPRHARRVLGRVGAIVEAPAAYGHLSGRTNLSLLDAAGPGGSRRTRRRRIEAALEQVGLSGVDRRPVKAYSLGMRQRLGLAAAVLRQPELLVLDEPTNGLDPQGIHEIRDLLLALNKAGTTIFMSSHLLAEVEQMCDRVGVLDRGRLVLQDDLAALRVPTGRVVLQTPDAEAAVVLLDGQLGERDGDRLVVRAGDAAELNATLVGAGIRVRELAAERRSLEQVVLAATNSGSDRVDRPGWPPPRGQAYPGFPPGPADATTSPGEPDGPGDPAGGMKPG
jgi:ABC-2 type transport system ATP-binding protein